MPATPPSASREISIFGTDAYGKAFFQTVRVASADGFEIAVEGLSCTLEMSNVVGVRHGGQKERFQVVWVGRPGTPQQGQVGLRSLEGGRSLLGLVGAQAPVPAKASFEGLNRRRHPRVSCQGSVQFRREVGGNLDAGILTCLSETGCYIATDSTAPCSASLDILVNAEGLELRSVGVVRASDPHGMGIAFGAMNPAHRARLQEWVFQHSRE